MIRLLRSNNQGFTLVETIIVLAIFGLVIPSVFSIITAIVRQQADIYRLTEMKRQGDFALAYIKQTILKDAEKIYAFSSNTYEEVCTQNGLDNDFYETTNNGVDFRMSSRSNPSEYIYFRTKSIGNMNVLVHGNTASSEEEITNDLVYIPYFHIECFQKSDFAAPLVSVQFAVVYKNRSGKSVNLNPLVYQTKFKLKK